MRTFVPVWMGLLRLMVGRKLDVTMEGTWVVVREPQGGVRPVLNTSDREHFDGPWSQAHDQLKAMILGGQLPVWVCHPHDHAHWLQEIRVSAHQLSEWRTLTDFELGMLSITPEESSCALEASASQSPGFKAAVPALVDAADLDRLRFEPPTLPKVVDRSPREESSPRSSSRTGPRTEKDEIWEQLREKLGSAAGLKRDKKQYQTAFRALYAARVEKGRRIERKTQTRYAGIIFDWLEAGRDWPEGWSPTKVKKELDKLRNSGS